MRQSRIPVSIRLAAGRGYAFHAVGIGNGKAIARDLVEIFYELYCNHYQIDKIKLVDEYDADDDPCGVI